MASIRSFSFLAVYIYAFFAHAASARHIHRPPRHQHLHARAGSPFRAATQATAIVQTLQPVPTVTGLAADLQEIRQGWDSLPSDLLAFVLAIELRLQEVETLLGALLNGTGSLPGASSTGPSAVAATALGSATTALSQGGSAQPSLCPPHAGAGPLIPCSPAPASTSLATFTYTSFTYTSTLSVSTAYIPMITGARNSSFMTEGYTYTTPGIPHPIQTFESISAVVITPSAFPNVTFSSAVLSTPTALRTAYTGFSNGTAFMSIPVTLPHQPSATPYAFNSTASDNVAVYYGSTPKTTSGSLLALCESPNVDIVSLGFVFSFFTPHGYPTIHFGPGCTGPNAVQAQQAPGLLDCSSLVPEIASCQELGKKVLVSLGGNAANTTISSDEQAAQLASTLWNLFGNGDGENSQLRPFGSGVVVDGFDIDNENANSAYYQTLATSLRQAYANDTSKTYYLSAAPQCPRPDRSIPPGAMLECDFVWVQFYNNPECNLDTAHFQSAFAAWSSDLAADGLARGVPKIYIGAVAWSGVNSGYVPGPGLETTVSLARELGTANLGGIMLWDGMEALANVDQYGDDYLVYAKASLQ